MCKSAIIDEEMLCKCVVSLAILRLCFKVGCKMMIDDRVLRLCFKVGCKIEVDQWGYALR